jgi:hypothetical protein
MTEPLVPPTPPPTTADAADFEYPLEMPYTLTQWRQAGDAVALRSMADFSFFMHLAIALPLLITAGLCSPLLWLKMGLGAVALALLGRGIFMVLFPHPWHLYIDGVALFVFGIVVAIVPAASYIYLHFRTTPASPGIALRPTMLWNLLGYLGFVWSMTSSGLSVLRTARQYGYLATQPPPPELITTLRAMLKTLRAVNPDTRDDLIYSGSNPFLSSRESRILLLDGYALVIENANKPLLLRRSEVAYDYDTTDKYGTMTIGATTIPYKLTPANLARLRAWKGETDA